MHPELLTMHTVGSDDRSLGDDGRPSSVTESLARALEDDDPTVAAMLGVVRAVGGETELVASGAGGDL